LQDHALRDILSSFPSQRILIVGDVMLDEYIWGEVQRISPEAPVPIVEIRERTYVVGGAANVAANVVSLGGQVLLGGVVGQDHPAEQFRQILARSGVETEGVLTDAQRPTTVKTRIVAHNQQIVRVDCEQRLPLPVSLEDNLLHWMEGKLPEVAACILSDYAKGVISTQLAQRFIQAAQRVGKPVIVDPKGVDYSKYQGASIVTPNIHEAEEVAHCKIRTEADLLEVGRRLVQLLGGHALLITRGPAGMSLFRNGLQPLHFPSAACSVFDVTGAGDTVVGTLSLALAAAAPLDMAAYLANQAAGIVVGKVGTVTVTLEELRSNLNSR